ncbi:hypothetical protein Gotur_005511 [Gossypium turneri]
MERTNSENMHIVIQPWFFLHSASKHGRKRKMKAVVSSEAEASIGVEQNDEASLIDVPSNDEAAPIDVPIIDEAALIDVPITYVENFSDLS